MNISLPPGLKQWLDQQIDSGDYGTASEYIRQLLRDEQRRQTCRAVETKLAEAEASGEPIPVTAQTWKKTEQRVQERLLAASRKRRDDGKNR